MFKKLRNRLILINLGITSIVIVIVFAIIYISSTHSASQRPPLPDNATEYTTDIENIIIFSLREEKQIAANQLLISLIVSGIAIELIVALVSYYLAEEAIKPVREAYESQKVFIANASHEIKTPLAAITANLEAADIHDNHWITNVEKETAKLTALNSELLTLARTDLVTETTISEVDLSQVVQESVKSFEPRMGQTKLTTKITSPNKTKINLADFEQILSILLDNAIKYSDRQITLALTSHELTVANDGAKIAARDLPHVFERFYQTDKTSDGVGLGLSIAKTLADRNNWKLAAKSDQLTSFTLTF